MLDNLIWASLISWTRIGGIGAGAMARAYAECFTRYNRGGTFVAVTGGSRAGELAAVYGVTSDPSVEALWRRSDAMV